MSQWTHVCGCIRYDALRFVEEIDFTKVLGHPFRFDDFPDNPKECGIPYGSEGSIQYKVITNPQIESLAAYTVAVWGDLRDFGEESVPKIEKWFEKITAKPLCVRNAVMEVEVEYGKTHVLQYKQ